MFGDIKRMLLIVDAVDQRHMLATGEVVDVWWMSGDIKHMLVLKEIVDVWCYQTHF